MQKIEFVHSVFSGSLFPDIVDKQKKCHQMSYLLYQDKTCDSNLNGSGISLLLPGNNLENTWNFISPEKCESCVLHVSNCITGILHMYYICMNYMCNTCHIFPIVYKRCICLKHDLPNVITSRFISTAREKIRENWFCSLAGYSQGN